MAKSQNKSAVSLIKYVVTLVRCDYDDINAIVKLAKGKNIDEVKIPISDVEEIYSIDSED